MMALRMCNYWRHSLSQVQLKMGMERILEHGIKKHSGIRNYRNLSFGDYKIGISEKIYMICLPTLICICFLDREKILKIIRGEDMENKYNADEVAAAFPNAEIVVRTVHPKPEDTSQSESV